MGFCYGWIRENLLFKMRQEVIFIAPAPRFLADFDGVQTEPSLIRLDHPHGGVTLPPGGFTLKRVENLKRLDPLFH